MFALAAKCEWCATIGNSRELYIDRCSPGVSGRIAVRCRRVCRWCKRAPLPKCSTTARYLATLHTLCSAYGRAREGAVCVHLSVVAAAYLSTVRGNVVQCRCATGTLGQNTALDFANVRCARSAKQATVSRRRRHWDEVVRVLFSSTPLPMEVVRESVLPFLLLWRESYVPQSAKTRCH